MRRRPSIARALDACAAWNALGAEVLDAPHARFVRAQRFAGVPGCNRVSHITAASPGEIARLREAAESAFAGASSLTFDVDDRTPPPFEARLVLEGLQRRDSLVMLLEGRLRTVAPAQQQDVRLITDDAAWSAWEALSISDNTGYPVRPGVAAGRADAAALTASRRAKCPPVRYFAAYQGSSAVGFFSAWEGAGGTGVTENLYVEQKSRHHGIAAALVEACVAHTRERGARSIALTCDPREWPKEWYARLGFVPVAVKRTYTRYG